MNKHFKMRIFSAPIVNNIVALAETNGVYMASSGVPYIACSAETNDGFVTIRHGKFCRKIQVTDEGIPDNMCGSATIFINDNGTNLTISLFLAEKRNFRIIEKKEKNAKKTKATEQKEATLKVLRGGKEE